MLANARILGLATLPLSPDPAKTAEFPATCQDERGRGGKRIRRTSDGTQLLFIGSTLVHTYAQLARTRTLGESR